MLMMASMLHTVLLLIVIAYIQNNSSQSCTVPGPCHLQCVGIDACKSTILKCYADYPCTIICDGKASCIDAIISGNTATDVTVICNGEDACKPTTINCGYGTCSLNCIPNNNICNGIFVNTNIAKSFQCFNQCPNNILQQVYTSNPTLNPSIKSTNNPATNPSISPTNIPSISSNPIKISTNTPTINPTQFPSKMSTTTGNPTLAPTNIPSSFPSDNPILSPLTKTATNYPTIEKANTNCSETDINHEIIVLTSNPTNLPLTSKAIISYGIIVTFTFDYKLSFYDTTHILEIIHDTINKLIVNVVSSSCIDSDSFNIESINKDNMELINASIFVCSRQQQKRLLFVLNTNNIICHIINSIQLQIGLQLPLNSTILQIHTISIYNESIPTSSPSLDIDRTKNNNYYGNHGNKMETILFIIIGTLAATSLIIGSAIFILNSNKIRKHVEKHNNVNHVSTNPITNLENHLSETTESPIHKLSTVDSNQNDNHIEPQNDNDDNNKEYKPEPIETVQTITRDIVNDEDYIHYEETVDPALHVSAAPHIIDGTIDETITETCCANNEASLWRTDIKQKSDDNMLYIDHLGEVIGDDETPNESKTFELPRYAIV